MTDETRAKMRRHVRPLGTWAWIPIAIVGLSSCMTAAVEPIIGAADRIDWPFPGTSFEIIAADSDEFLGTFIVTPGEDNAHHQAVLLDPLSEPSADFPEPIPFVLAEFQSEALAEAGIGHAYLVEWGAGQEHQLCRVQSFWPQICAHVLVVTFPGEEGVSMPVLEEDHVLAVPGSSAIVVLQGGGAGFMTFDPLLTVREGVSAADLFALLADARLLALANNVDVSVARLVPVARD